MMYILSQLVNSIGSAVRKDFSVKLGVRVGFLKISHGQLKFDNLASERDMDQASRTSCNTNVRNLKFTLTGMGGHGTEFEDKITYHTESVRDTIS